MKEKQITIYSKKDGVNQFLFTGNDLITSMNFIVKELKEHKHFAYALVDGIEIKLFINQEDA